MLISNCCIRRLLSVFILLFSVQLHALELTQPETALKQYVNYEDNMFNMQHMTSFAGAGYTVHLYNLTSQQWLNETIVDRSIWTHSLLIVVPDKVTGTTGMLLVAGESNDDPLPDAKNSVLEIITQLALGSQTIVSAVFQVPNQPIIFDNNGIPTAEDKLVAISWDKAVNTGNYANAAYLPMVKSVVKAMDGIQAVLPVHGNNQVNDFVLTGFSKRGATVWLTAAIDPRIKAIAPGVIDVLNIIPNIEHQYKSYGAYSSAIKDYVELKITDRIRAPEFKKLTQVIDPYAYLDKLDMPKFILNSTGDEFFLPDSSRFYLQDLKGETLIRFAANTGHSLSNSDTGVLDTLYSVLGWYQSILLDIPRPEISWEKLNNQLFSHTSQTPAAVKVWSAYNATARDFRKDTIGESWTSINLPVNNTGDYSVALANTTSGFHATYIEFIYSGVSGLPLTYSTQIYVTPDVYPYVLENPVVNPRASSYWSNQLKALLKNKSWHKRELIDEQTWLSYLPLPLFDEIVDDLDAVNEVYTEHSMRSAKQLAQRECLTTRLNIQSGELGWYSVADLGYRLGNKFLWQHYQLADEQVDNMPLLSATICLKLNQLNNSHFYQF